MREKYNITKSVVFSKQDLKLLEEKKRELGFSSDSATIRYLLRKN